MSSIFKLQITGVRSFDPDEKQAIQFSKPLTLIVGQNGTGKTTIIECLKYATTGDLPPNSKGGAFVHDPSMKGSNDVSAQVKLAFTTVDQRQAIVTRSMQLVQKKTVRSFKTLDSNIQFKKRKNEKSDLQVNSRCSDIGAEMSNLLGVSKAVLEYVVFCHQEDSLWPLAEASVVKKRFDEIFEATKFTKALENIKTIRKDYTNDCKVQQKDVERYRVDRDRANQKQTTADELEEQIKEYEEECEALKREMDEATKKQKELFESNQQFQEVLYKLEQLRRDKKGCEDSMNRLTSNMDEMSESDEELQSMLDNFATNTDARRQKKLQFEEDLAQVNDELSSLRQSWNTHLTRQGQLEAQKTAHEANLKSRDQFVEKTKNAFEIESSDAEGLMSEMESKSEQLEFDLERERNLSSTAEGEYNHSISELSLEKSKMEQNKSNAKNEQREIEASMKNIQQEIDMIQVDEGQLEFENSKLREYEDDLKRHQQKLDDLGTDEKLKEKYKEKSELDGKMNQLNEEFRQASHQADNRSKLNYYKNDSEHKRTAQNAVITRESARYEKHVKSPIQVENVELKLNERMKEVQADIDKQNSEIRSVQHEKSSVDTKKSLVEDELMSKRRELRNFQESLENKGYSSAREFQNDYDQKKVLVEALSQTDIFTKYYKSAIEHARGKDPCCLLCGTQFDESMKSDFIIQMNGRIEALNKDQEGEDIQADALKDTQAELEEMEKVLISIPRINSIEDDEIPQLESDLNDLTKEIKLLEDRDEENANKLDSLRQELGELESLRKVASDIARYNTDINNLDASIKQLEETLGGATSGRSAEHIHAELTELGEETKVVDKAITQLVKNRDDAKNAVQSSHQNIANKKLDISKLQTNLYQKQAKQEQIKNMKSKQEKLKNDISEATKKLSELVPQIDKYQNELRQLKHDNERKMQLLREQQNKMSRAIYELTQLNESIDKYNGDEELVKCEKDMQACSEETKNKQIQAEKLQDQISNEEKAMIDMKSHERELRDNLEVRRLRNEIKAVSNEITKLESKNAEREKNEYEIEAKRLRDKYAELSSQHAGRMGEVRQMQDQWNSIMSEIDLNYKDVHENYRKAVLKLTTTKHANEDLARYAKALDSAVMKYHAMKMERINKTIDELWKKTYTGTDIDTICVKSDNEGRGNRTYNYRVVMVKQDVELDMRGRCSAGQKVLACIIIRLALSETFGQNCGLIALDEPTTNLDAKNIEALAKGLNVLLENRKNQKNFQLITITHDVEFLRHLGASAYVDYYYKVERNRNQSSTITQTDIHTIDE